MSNRSPIVWVWRIFKFFHCQKGMCLCAYITIKLIKLEVKHQLKK